MIKLKPCPICGGKVNLSYYSPMKEYRIWHSDKRCALKEPIAICDESIKSLKDAAEFWNRRA